MKIQVHDKIFAPYLSASQIQARIKMLGAALNQRYKQQCPVILSILNGSFMFTADLVKQFTFDCELSFIKLASYQGTTSSGVVKTLLGLEVDLEGRSVLIVEDIVDSGKTLHEFLPILRKQNPVSIEIATLLLKPNALKYPLDLAYVGFEIPNHFVVGYGMDYNGLGRNYTSIYQLSEA